MTVIFSETTQLFCHSITKGKLRFLPRDAMHKRGICRHAVSVCLSVSLSVRLYVTFVSCAKTNKDIFEIFSPYGSQAILVFPYQTGWRYRRMQGGMKNGRFSTNISLYLRNGNSFR